MLKNFLAEKMPNWKIGLNIERYIRYGYLGQDDIGQLFLDWRTRAEVDQKALITMLLSSEAQKAKMAEPKKKKARTKKTKNKLKN